MSLNSARPTVWDCTPNGSRRRAAYGREQIEPDSIVFASVGDLLKKHSIPIYLKDALRTSINNAMRSKTEIPNN